MESRRPLVYLAGDLSCEAQRGAVAVGDQLRADSQISVSLFVTEATATLRQLQHALFNG